MVVGGLVLIAVGPLLSSIPQSAIDENMTDADLAGITPSLLGGASAAMGAIVLAIGIASFVVAYGLLKGKGWSWTLTVVLSIISIVLNAVSIVSGNIGGIISIIISAVILYYLYRPHVKAYFGKGKVAV